MPVTSRQDDESQAKKDSGAESAGADSEQSLQQINAHLQRCIAETHHRTKNTLQNVISYINVMFSQRDSISKVDVKKLVNYIHVLTSLQDMIIAQTRRNSKTTSLRLDQVIYNVIELAAVRDGKDASVQCDHIPVLRSTPRVAATTSLIVTELIDNSQRHGSGKSVLEVSLAEDHKVNITISNAVERSAAIVKGNGLKLIEVLARADLGSEVNIVVENQRFSVSFKVPVSLI